MRLISRLASFARRIFHGHNVDRDLDAEIQSALELLTDQKIAQGMGPEEARRTAIIELGGVEQVKEEVRAVRTGAWLDSLLQDIRFAFRMLRKNPIFALTAIASLSLAIGANTAVYSIIDAALLRPLPLPQPGRLFMLSTPESDQSGLPAFDSGDTFSYPLYEQLSSAAGNSAQLALFDSPGATEIQIASPNAQPERVTTQSISPNALDMLGVSPAVGELFSPNDERYPSPRMAPVLFSASRILPKSIAASMGVASRC